MNGLLNVLQMLYRVLTKYEQRQREKALKARLWNEIATPPPPSMNPAGLETDLTEIQTGNRPTVRRNCAFCGRERSALDDNHAPECAYWTVGPGKFAREEQ